MANAVMLFQTLVARVRPLSVVSPLVGEPMLNSLWPRLSSSASLEDAAAAAVTSLSIGVRNWSRSSEVRPVWIARLHQAAAAAVWSPVGG